MFVCISLAWWLSLSCWLPAPVSLDSLYRVFFLVNLGKKNGDWMIFYFQELVLHVLCFDVACSTELTHCV